MKEAGWSIEGLHNDIVCCLHQIFTLPNCSRKLDIRATTGRLSGHREEWVDFFYHIIAHFYIFNWEKEKSENNGCQVEGISVKLPGRNSIASGQSEAQRVAVVFCANTLFFYEIVFV